ncbi:hypothetical protein M409DRAFT_25178 [Zasmidium cellare ATCC 36951]|uniref:Uncharacterized protein n=1 Tax=Zasmidium cellare ATCC 36951 TaxID=1080233 RepID=A0A6A6CF48_ZASCE|nr:uncharacterized protein M409DRAFT_25178 [Zasmidium cellare ATCC 36951]KAF2164299.1 hypothetical protein M409DRAFT_25178 [Zasmidium cellare ATCC 36951]
MEALHRQQGLLDEEQELVREQRKLVRQKQELNQRIIEEMGRRGEGADSRGQTHVPSSTTLTPIDGPPAQVQIPRQSAIGKKNVEHSATGLAAPPAPAIGSKVTSLTAFGPPPTTNSNNPKGPSQQNTYARYDDQYPTLAAIDDGVFELACYFCMGNHFRKGKGKGPLQPIQGVRGMHTHINSCHEGEQAHDNTPRGYEWVARNCVDKRLSKADLKAAGNREYVTREVVEVSYRTAA